MQIRINLWICKCFRMLCQCNNCLSFPQKSCIDFAIQAKPLELYVPPETTGIRYHIWRLVTSQPFENFIMLLILMNTILLMLKVDFSFVASTRLVGSRLDSNPGETNPHTLNHLTTAQKLEIKCKHIIEQNG